jgi:hypothetical protein
LTYRNFKAEKNEKPPNCGRFLVLAVTENAGLKTCIQHQMLILEL